MKEHHSEKESCKRTFGEVRYLHEKGRFPSRLYTLLTRFKYSIGLSGVFFITVILLGAMLIIGKIVLKYLPTGGLLK